MNKGIIYALILIVLVALGYFGLVANSDKPSWRYVEKTVTESIITSEVPMTYSFSVPSNYESTEIAPGELDYNLGISKILCVHDNKIDATEEKCDINIASMPANFIGGSLEDDIKLAGDAVVEYASTTFAGMPAFEVIFSIEPIQGYRILFSNPVNNRVYSITALVPEMNASSTLASARESLSVVQKKFIDSFKVVAQ